MEETKTTVDENELKHFDSLVKTWWEDATTLHRMNDVRIPALIKSLEKSDRITTAVANSEKPLAGLKILDVGCGGGILSEPLAELGGEVTGLDAVKNLVECAKLHAEKNEKINNNLNYVYDTIENFSTTHTETFDVIVASEIIEHVASVDLFLESCIKALKPNGAIYITTINRTIKSFFIAKLLYEYVLDVINKGTHSWNKFITPDELENALKKYNCKKEYLEGWQYSYFNEKFDFCADTSIFYYMYATKSN